MTRDVILAPTISMGLVSNRFNRIFIVDTEFQALPGEKQTPVSVCALHYVRAGTSFKRAEDVRMFIRDGQDHPCPFPGINDDDTLFLTYNGAAEFKCFIALDWPMPANCIDLMFEYKNMTCGVWRGSDELWQLGYGLEAAVRELGGNPADAWRMDKHAMQSYIRRFGRQAPRGFVGVEIDKRGLPVYIDVDGDPQPFNENDPYIREWITRVRTQEEHERLILDYNREDCVATHFVAQQIVRNSPAYNEDQAIHRGRFAVSTAWFEHNGIPIDADRFGTIKKNAKKLQIHIAQEIEKQHGFGVYEIEGREDLKNKPHAVWKMKNFVALLESHGITIGKRGAAWDATPTGDPVLEDDYFETMCNAYPFLQPLRQTRKTLKTLGLFNTVLGADGFNRYSLFPFGQKTSRNNPGASEFMLGRPHWMRMLITPKPGYAVVSADITGAEDWLAAGYSGDPNLMQVYSSGADSYIEFAIVTGALPPGSKRDKSDREMERIRAQHKIAKLAIQYGVGPETLSKQLGVPLWKAGQILAAHRSAYAVYWQWVDDQALIAANRGYVVTDFGWRESTMNMNDRAILNYPQQSGCAEVLRMACNLLLDGGWGFVFSAPHHDAVYAHCPIERAEECAHAIEAAFLEAGKIVMASATDPEFAEKLPLRIRAKITPHPEHYVDPDGADIWKIVCEYFKWDEFAVLDQEEEVHVENSSEARDGVSAL
jgi:DNA polymerase-1